MDFFSFISCFPSSAADQNPSCNLGMVYNEKLNQVRSLFRETIKESQLEGFIMIDTIQCLGIDYHFQQEIQSFLTSYYACLTNDAGLISSHGDDTSLFNIALVFRILRQNGHHVTTSVFDIFMEQDGKFKEQLTGDLRGMIALYQASQFGTGEEILIQANVFTSKYLHDSLPHLHQVEASIVNDAFEHQYDKSITRFNVKCYIESSTIQHRRGGTILQELAKMDFNIVQSLHQKELLLFSSWWRDLGLAQHLNFARQQLVKWYTWSLAILTNPIYSDQRIDLTKSISFVYLMDDIYDVYGTLDELVLFTKTIKKWEVDANDPLPYPMKIFLQALFDTTNEISHKIFMKHGWNPINSLKNAWRHLCDAFLVEAKWFNAGHSPTSEEYLKNGVVSTGVHVALVHFFFLLGEGINTESVELVDNTPGLILYPATILRLWDDLGNAKDENQLGHDGSYIDYYMKEHKCSSLQGAREHVGDMISNAWKKLKMEFLLPSPFSLTFKKASLNAASMVHFMYSYDSDQGLAVLEKHIKSLLYESIPTVN